MALSLYDAFVPGALQVLGSLDGLIDKAEQSIADGAFSDADLLEAKLAEDMWPLPMHVRSCWMHGAYTFSQIPDGEFTPDFTDVPNEWAAMRAMIGDARTRLEHVDADALEAMSGNTVAFVMGGKRLMEFTAQDFLLSFNQPNLYFHSATFYDILRMKGLPLGKRDYLGTMRLKTA